MAFLKSFSAFMLKDRGIGIEKVSTKHIDAGFRDNLLETEKHILGEHAQIAEINKASTSKVSAIAELIADVKHHALDLQAHDRAEKVGVVVSSVFQSACNAVVNDWLDTWNDMSNAGRLLSGAGLADYLSTLRKIRAEYLAKMDELNTNLKQARREFEDQLKALSSALANQINTKIQLGKAKISAEQVLTELQKGARSGTYLYDAGKQDQSIAQAIENAETLIKSMREGLAELESKIKEVDESFKHLIDIAEKAKNASTDQEKQKWLAQLKNAWEKFINEFKRAMPSVQGFASDLKKIPSLLAGIQSETLNTISADSESAKNLLIARAQEVRALSLMLNYLAGQERLLTKAGITTPEQSEKAIKGFLGAMDSLKNVAA